MLSYRIRNPGRGSRCWNKRKAFK